MSTEPTPDDDLAALLGSARRGLTPTADDRARSAAALSAQLAAAAVPKAIGAKGLATALKGLASGKLAGLVAVATVAAVSVSAAVSVARAPNTPQAPKTSTQSAPAPTALFASPASPRPTDSRVDDDRNTSPAPAPVLAVSSPLPTAPGGQAPAGEGPTAKSLDELEPGPRGPRGSGLAVPRDAGPSKSAGGRERTGPDTVGNLPARIPTPTATIGEEIRLIHAAETALRAGDSAEALTLLAEHARRFPSGVLAEEREGERAIVECASGIPEGRAAAARFERAYAGSAMGPRVDAACR